MSTNLAPIPSNLPATPGMFGSGTPAMGASSGPKISPLMRYLAALRRFKWLILLLTAVGFGGGILVSRLRPESYAVSSTIVLAEQPTASGAIQSGPIYASSQWKELMQSYQVLEQVAISRQLYIIGPKQVGAPPPGPGPSGPNKDLFNGFTLGEHNVPGDYELKIGKDGRQWELTNTGTSTKESGAVGDSVGRRAGFMWQPAIPKRWYGQTFTLKITTPREESEHNKGRLGITMERFSAKFLHLSLTGTDGEGTAGTLNDVMKAFVNEAIKLKKRDLIFQVATLDTQLITEQSKLSIAQKKLENFKVHTITLPREDLPLAPGLQQTTGLGYSTYEQKRTQLAGMRNDRRDLQDALTRATAGDLVVDQFMSNNAVRSSTQLIEVVQDLSRNEAKYRELLVRCPETSVQCDDVGANTSGTGAAGAGSPGAGQSWVNMPKLKAHIDELRKGNLQTYSKAVLRQLDLTIARTDSAVKNSETELQDIPGRTITEDQLLRERNTEANIVDALTQRYAAARLVEASANPDVSIMDNATAPLRPSKNRRLIMIAMGAILGLATGLGLALLFDMTDKRVRYADQITSGLGLTILGVIPELKRAKGETPTPEEAAQVIEAFRTVRLNLSHTVGDGGVVFTISSPSPGDGKSLVSSNLALSFAEAGYKTLLIDGDTRRGELHRTFGVERRPGLLDYLAGEMQLEALVRATTHPQLRLITAGSRKRNAPELLGSGRMRELVATMRERFEVVIIDSPPLGAGIDPFVLGTITGNLLLVVRAGATERDLAEAKLQIVDQLPIRMIGAVLNDVRATMNEYKYYSYSYGYGAVEEGESRGTLPQILDA